MSLAYCCYWPCHYWPTGPFLKSNRGIRWFICLLLSTVAISHLKSPTVYYGLKLLNVALCGLSPLLWPSVATGGLQFPPVAYRDLLPLGEGSFPAVASIPHTPDTNLT